MSDIKRLIHDTAAAPLGQIIASVGEGVAQAQRALDEQALAQLEALYRDNDEAMALLRRSGWQPTFYTLPETEGEVKVALSLSGAQGGSGKAARPTGVPSGRSLTPRLALYAAPVDAGYQNRFGYQATVGASLRFRIVPVPPPAGVEELPIVAVPQLIGMASAAAQELLAEFRLEATVAPSGAPSGIVAAQDPAPGEVLRRGDVVTLTLEAPPDP
ncbi:PASTA domain-containing protein [Halomonas denitrificans]|uniref:PASTA domain-containing protein n=1 Tax=Halomonas denitrificans TaxID=370769 RepID=UPI000D33BD7A|nr:PASTA domain-containing protein [Halomonas denitrificans]